MWQIKSKKQKLPSILIRFFDLMILKLDTPHLTV